MNDFENKLRAQYEIGKIPQADHFLGIRIVRDRAERKLWLISSYSRIVMHNSSSPEKNSNAYAQEIARAGAELTRLV
jgi:hypothetical protein